jgi:hypothetical protein
MSIIAEDRTRRWRDIFRLYGTAESLVSDRRHATEASGRAGRQPLSESLLMDPLWREERKPAPRDRTRATR